MVDIIKERFGANEPVLAEDILALLPGISRQAAYKKIEAAVASGELARYGRGVYYVPEQTRFGASALPAMSVVKRKWLQDESGAIGYVTGAALANEAGFTEQVPAVLEVATNRETTRVREASPFRRLAQDPPEAPACNGHGRQRRCPALPGPGNTGARGPDGRGRPRVPARACRQGGAC